MPLTRQTVTVASRVMLPTYVAFFAILGANYLIADDTAAASPALVFADNVMPLHAWGWLFIGCAGIMLAALFTHRRNLYRWALRSCGLSMLFWSAVIAWASLSGDATPFAAAWAAFVTTATYATDRSLASRER
jgi:hypothetical protein